VTRFYGRIGASHATPYAVRGGPRDGRKSPRDLLCLEDQRRSSRKRIRVHADLIVDCPDLGAAEYDLHSLFTGRREEVQLLGGR
jgi:hypothetical protein